MISDHSMNIIQGILTKNLDLSTHKVFVFGSQADQKINRTSDIDIGIEGKKPVDLLTISNLKSDFEDSNIPETVDVVDFCRVSDKFKQVAMQHIILLN